MICYLIKQGGKRTKICVLTMYYSMREQKILALFYRPATRFEISVNAMK